MACLGLTACATTYTESRPADYDSAYGVQTNVSQERSLFSSDEKILSDADIARILEYNYTAPPLSRIAIMPFGWAAWSGWSEQMAIATDTIDNQVISSLRSSSRVYDATFLPSILVPEKRTVPFLREAGARYQADLLLAFRTACQTFERYRLFKANQTRAFCSVEAVLLDVRTGLVPFVATSTKAFVAVESPADLNLRETILRSQLEANGNALGEISQNIVRFIERQQ
jgi:hypothetical protein